MATAWPFPDTSGSVMSISPVSVLLSFINLHFRSIENLSGFIHRQGQHINRQIVQCQAAYRQFSCAITLNPEGRQRIIPAHAL